MKKTLVFMNFAPTSRIFGDKVDPDWYRNNKGYCVHFWDLSPIYFNKKALASYYDGADGYAFNCIGLKRFQTRQNVRDAISHLPSNTIVFHLTRFGEALVDDFWVLKQLKKKQIPYVVQKIESAIVLSDQGNENYKSFLKRFQKLLHWSFAFKVLKHFLVKAKSSLFKQGLSYDIPLLAFGVGIAGRREFRELSALGTRFISIPSPMINWQLMNGPKIESICVFVDESIGYAPDAKLNGYNTTIDLVLYYKNLQNCFDLIEKSTGFNVVVCASGKVDYKDNPFKRPIVFKETLQYISRSSMVLGHSSSALYQAVWLKKPLIILDDPTFSDQKKTDVRLFSSWLNIPLISSNKITESDISNASNTERLDSIVNDYFCEDGVEGGYKDIIGDELDYVFETYFS